MMEMPRVDKATLELQRRAKFEFVEAYADVFFHMERRVEGELWTLYGMISREFDDAGPEPLWLLRLETPQHVTGATASVIGALYASLSNLLGKDEETASRAWKIQRELNEKT